MFKLNVYSKYKEQVINYIVKLGINLRSPKILRDLP